MMREYKEKIRLFFLIAYIIFAVGTTVGAVYYVNCNSSTGDIKNILNSYVQSIKAGMNSKNIVINTLKSNLTLLLLMFVSIFFRAGVLLSAFLVVRKGFITGFTVASIIGEYGINGLPITAISTLQYIIVIPVMLLFYAVNQLFTLKIINPERKNIIFYILFFVIIISIFCIESLLEGIYSTTFMKWLLNSVT